MRVLLDVTYANRAPFSGTAVYLDRLQQALRRLGGVEIVQARNLRRGPAAGSGAGSARNLLIDRWWAAVELPRLARDERVDVIHHPLPEMALSRRTPQVVTVHDLAFERLPGQFDRAFRVYAHLNHRAAALAAGAVICVSETTAADVRAIWGVPAERIVVAHHGPGQELARSDGERPADTLERSADYFLYVGDDEPRKNVSVLLAAYQSYREQAEAPLELVLAGSVTARGTGVRTEYRPDPARLIELYGGAAALVQPSLYEGFGLTTLEAMSAGTPVLAATSPGVVEVCSNAVRYADPGDASTFTLAMIEIAASAALRKELAERGIARAAEFSWDASARAHLDAYSLAVGK